MFYQINQENINIVGKIHKLSSAFCVDKVWVNGFFTLAEKNKNIQY